MSRIDPDGSVGCDKKFGFELRWLVFHVKLLHTFPASPCSSSLSPPPLTERKFILSVLLRRMEAEKKRRKKKKNFSLTKLLSKTGRVFFFSLGLCDDTLIFTHGEEEKKNKKTPPWETRTQRFSRNVVIAAFARVYSAVWITNTEECGPSSILYRRPRVAFVNVASKTSRELFYIMAYPTYIQTCDQHQQSCVTVFGRLFRKTSPSDLLNFRPSSSPKSFTSIWLSKLCETLPDGYWILSSMWLDASHSLALTLSRLAFVENSADKTWAILRERCSCHENLCARKKYSSPSRRRS